MNEFLERAKEYIKHNQGTMIKIVTGVIGAVAGALIAGMISEEQTEEGDIPEWMVDEEETEDEIAEGG
jgi:uncharacterized membrane protein YeaQ/YmgE (transglycosylase-associated protein family)